jgi:hypothetical protein
MRRALAASILLAPLLLAAERPPAAPPNALPDERIDRIVSELRSKFATAGPTARASSAGAVVLDEERVHFATARIGPDGKPHVDCSKGTRAAARAVLEPAATPAHE